MRSDARKRLQPPSYLSDGGLSRAEIVARMMDPESLAAESAQRQRESDRLRTITIPLPWSKPPLTGNRTRGNPYARAGEVKAAKERACDAVLESFCWAVVGADVTLHFQPSTKQRRDADGLFPTLKVCQDALVILGVLPADDWVHVPAATCRIHPPNGEPARMWLSLTSITDYEEQPK